MTKEEIEHLVSKGTTDHGKVKCLYFDETFTLIKWPGGSFWNGMDGNSYVSPWVTRYEMDQDLKYRHGREVWNCGKDKDGRLTITRLAELIEREKLA